MSSICIRANGCTDVDLKSFSAFHIKTETIMKVQGSNSLAQEKKHLSLFADQPCKVIFKDPHEDDDDEAQQQHHQHQ